MVREGTRSAGTERQGVPLFARKTAPYEVS